MINIKENIQPEISVIIVNWNTLKVTSDCIQSLIDIKEISPIEIIIIDNASHDGSVEALRNQFPSIKIIANETNVGFAAGCNQGLEQASGKYLLLLNSDTTANGESLKGMMDFLKNHPKVGAVGCRLLYADGTVQSSHGNFPTPSEFLLHQSLLAILIKRFFSRLKNFFPHIKHNQKPYKVDWLMGACIMMPREIYRKVGGFDPDYFMYCEDADWCFRLAKEGYSIYHLPQYSIFHYHQQSSRQRKKFTFIRIFQSLNRFVEKNYGESGLKKFKFVVLLDMISRLPIYAFFWLITPRSRSWQAERLSAAFEVIKIYLQGEKNNKK